MRVYRIEKKDGSCGLYGLQDLGVEAYRYTRRPVSAPDYDKHHANPFNDKGLKGCPFVLHGLRAIHPAMHCAFESIEALHKWFPPRRLCDMASEAGHIVGIGEYEVDEELVQRGEKQVLFPMRLAERVAVHEVDEYSANCPQETD